MVTKKPKGLGRGLEALLGPKVEASEGGSPAAESGTPMTMALDQMVAGMYQPRTRMDEGALYELAESIKAQGIMQPILVRQRLPFASVLVGSRNDPFCTLAKAQALAADWGARWVDLGEAGHINADSGLGDWPEGHALLQQLMNKEE